MRDATDPTQNAIAAKPSETAVPTSNQSLNSALHDIISVMAASMTQLLRVFQQTGELAQMVKHCLMDDFFLSKDWKGLSFYDGHMLLYRRILGNAGGQGDFMH